MITFFVRIALCCLLISSSLVSKAQQKKLAFKFVDARELPLTVDQHIAYQIYGGRLFFCNTRPANPSDSSLKGMYVVLYSKDLQTADLDSTRFNLPLDEADSRWTVSDISISSDNVAILLNKIFLFTRAGKFIASIPSYRSDQIKLLKDDRLFIYKNYDSNPKDDTLVTKMVLYDTRRQNEVKFLRPTFNYPGYTHLIGSYMATCGDDIAFAQTMPYQIDFFDGSLEKKSSITTNTNNSPKSYKIIDSLHAIARQTLGVKELIMNLRAVDSFNRIEKIYFLSRDTMLVIRTVPAAKFSFRTLDVWVRNGRGKTWTKLVDSENYVVERPQGEAIVTADNLPVTFTTSNALLFSKNHDVYYVTKSIPPQLGKPANGYDAYKDAYYSNHEINYSLWHFRWELL